MKTFTGIKRINEEKHFGSWFSQLFELVKAMNSCLPEMAIGTGWRGKKGKRQHESESHHENESNNEVDDAVDNDKT